MLYELIAIVSARRNETNRQVRPGYLSEARECVSRVRLLTCSLSRTAGRVVLRNNGVVRGLSNWGTFMLSAPIQPKGGANMAKEAELHTSGHYFVMRFDCSAIVQHQLRKTLALDPRLLRFGVVKLGSTLDQIKDYSGDIEWGSGRDL